MVYLRTSMVLRIPQSETAAYRSRSHRERSDRAKALQKGSIMPPPYRSRGHREGSDVYPVSHGADVLPYRGRSRPTV